jgi:hypothetical protein
VSKDRLCDAMKHPRLIAAFDEQTEHLRSRHGDRR